MPRKSPNSPVWTACEQLTSGFEFIQTDSVHGLYLRGATWRSREFSYLLTEHALHQTSRWLNRPRVETIAFVLGRLAWDPDEDGLYKRQDFHINRTGVTRAYFRVAPTLAESPIEKEKTLEAMNFADEAGVTGVSIEDEIVVGESLEVGLSSELQPLVYQPW